MPSQVITCLFLENNYLSLVLNMFPLGMFGSDIERTLGSKSFVLFFIFCGIGGFLNSGAWQTK